MRHVEIRLASLLSLVFELTISVFGISMLVGRRFPTWVGWLGLLGGLGTLAAGIAQAYTGFSALAMMLSMPEAHCPIQCEEQRRSPEEGEGRGPMQRSPGYTSCRSWLELYSDRIMCSHPS